MQNLTVQHKIKVEFTPEQWQLFTTRRGCKRVTKTLNTTLTRLVNSRKECFEVYRDMLGVMAKYHEYGAVDTEPVMFLEQALNTIYGQDSCSF